MPSLARFVAVIGLVILVAGGVCAGWGVYQRLVHPCKSGYGLSITQLNGTETADSGTEHVAYSDLSTNQQRVFREILNAETTPIYRNATPLEGLARTVITYRGERYETSPMSVSDCANTPSVFQFFGGLTALLGGVVAATAYGWTRFRS